MKKKGFTLIELLAVIIILAVIALIAAPVVLNIIEQVKIKGAESSAKGYAKAVEYEILNDTMFKGKNLDGEYDVEENVLEVVYQGNGPSEGYFILTRNEITYGEFCINGYGIKYENSIGKYAPDEVTCGSVPKHEFIEPEGVACTDIENYDEETNFKIKTVEDLVCVSNLSNNGKTFSGKTVMLLSDIDINDSNSYNDINDTTYGDINGNGTVEGIQVELTTGSGFLPIGSSSIPFSGTFEGYGFTLSNLMINRNVDNVGLFGYVNGGVIKGINVNDITVTGKNLVGAIVGNLYSGTVNEINLSGNITGTGESIGGLVGRSEIDGNKIISVIVNANVEGYKYIGGVFGTSNVRPTVNCIMETGTLTGDNSYKIGYGSNGNKYTSTEVISTYDNGDFYDGIRYTLSDEMLNGYDNAIDTWIGGDNDSSGYYFDYDENNKLIVKSVERDPITFTLKGEGTEEKPYLINNYQQWKEATTKIKQDVYFKLNTDIDFSNKPYYAMGSASNYLVATIDGGYHTISNININGMDNFGIAGYINGGTFKGFNINNSSVMSNKDNVGLISGYVNNSGKVVGLNVNNITVTGKNNTGGIVGYLYSGIVNEVNLSGNIDSTGESVGGLVGRSEIDGNNITSVIVNANVKGNKYIGGVFGTSAARPTVNCIMETGTLTGENSYKIGYGSNGNKYTSRNVISTYDNGDFYDGIRYTLELPTTVIYTENNNRVEIDSLSYYDSVGTLDTRIGGDNDNSGYYLDYNSSGNKIIVVPSGANSGGGSTGTQPSIDIDHNFTMTQINGTTDTTAPTCELYYVRAVSNGIQASFSCTDDSGVPTLRSLFDSTTSKSAQTFDNIGTLKNGSVSGNTKTVVSTWNVNNAISQPTPGTCYYFRYGAKDAENNFSTYVTNVCYKGFSE